MPLFLRLLAAMHRRGFHAAVLAGLVMMPAVIGVGFATDHAVRSPAPDVPAADLRGSLAEAPRTDTAALRAF